MYMWHVWSRSGWAASFACWPPRYVAGGRSCGRDVDELEHLREDIAAASEICASEFQGLKQQISDFKASLEGTFMIETMVNTF